jgi:hypothetical protein
MMAMQHRREAIWHIPDGHILWRLRRRREWSCAYLSWVCSGGLDVAEPKRSVGGAPHGGAADRQNEAAGFVTHRTCILWGEAGGEKVGGLPDRLVLRLIPAT